MNPGEHIRKAYAIDQRTERQKAAHGWAYAAWRFMEWTKGGKTYTEIDGAVRRGELKPAWGDYRD